MHDLDRTDMEDAEDYELGAEDEVGEYDEREPGGYGHEMRASDAAVFGEDEVAELAGELLGVSNDHELDRFLGGFLDKAARAVGGALGAGKGQGIGGILKGIAKKAIPMVANAYAPGVGGAITGLLGMELEGLSAEDQEFEAAKQYIRLGADAVQRTIAAPDGGDPLAVAQTAMAGAAQRFAPGLLRGVSPGSSRAGTERQSGRWYRRGSHIVLQGL